jgi:cobalt-zinc-cadmium efflux system outer membrane protein
MVRTIRPPRLNPSTASATCVVRTLLVGVLVGLMGCAVQDYSPPLLPTFMQEQTPAGVTSSVGQGDPYQSSTRFSDSISTQTVPASSESRTASFPGEIASVSDAPQSGEPSSPQPTSVRSRGLTLEQAIRTALEADPKIQAGLEIIKQAKADLLTASLSPNPQFSTSGTLLPLDRPFTVNRQGGPPQFDVGMSYPIDWFLFGKRAAEITSARLGVDMSAADFADLVRQRVAGTIAAFYDVLEAQALLDLAREDLDNLKRVETITADRVALGGVGTIELDRIRLAVFDSQREVRNRDTAVATALTQLRAFLGLTNTAPLFAVQGSLEVPTPTTPLTVEDAVALAQQNRPDLLSVRRQLAKAEADILVEQKKVYPEVTPHLGYTRQFQEKAIGFPDVNDWGLEVEVTVPLFDRNQGNIAKAQSVQRQTSLNLRAQLVDLRSEVEQAVKAYQTAYVTVTTDDPAQLKAAENVRDKIRAAYELGGKPLIEVLDAQRAYRDTYRLYITGRSTYWHALHRLNAAVGRQVLQ